MASFKLSNSASCTGSKREIVQMMMLAFRQVAVHRNHVHDHQDPNLLTVTVFDATREVLSSRENTRKS
jgi:hypothetical protein